jgi:predicted ATP-grasp superfamily ATP-dependent carboligase
MVTNANTKHALAAVRTLGRKGVDVIAAADTTVSMAFISKYTKKKLIYPSPQNISRFTEVMIDYLKKTQCNVVLPIGTDVAIAISKQLDKFLEYAGIPIPQYNDLIRAYDKAATFRLASRLNVPMPKTYFPQTTKNVKKICKELEYPIVIKARRSAGAKGVFYVQSSEELIDTFGKLQATPTYSIFDDFRNPLIQEYIPGESRGFFTLFDHGKPIAFFAHRRLREYPPTGGASVVAESIACEPEMKHYGIKLLKALNWHGVAMVEFKKDYRDERTKLIEINPKFWGSLDLAITAGVDFPYLAYKLAVGERVNTVMNYRCGVKFRWLLPDDVLYLFSSMNKGASVRDFIKFREKNMYHDITLEDPLPTIIQLGKTIKLVVSSMRNLRA